MEKIIDMIDFDDCPFCNGPALIEEESGWGYYIVCADCGAHTGVSEFHSDAGRLEAAKKAATLWNIGKILKEGVGE